MIFSVLTIATALFSGIALAIPTTTQPMGVFRHHDNSVGAGACGTTHSTTELTVALGYQIFYPQTPGGSPNNPLCGKKIRASANGKSVDVTVTDRCPSIENCSGDNLDLSTSAFAVLAPLASGVVSGTWEWLN
jgi:hypothetical protein